MEQIPLKYARWIGAVLGFMLLRSPIGAVLGFFAGYVIEVIRSHKESAPRREARPGDSVELETNVMVLAAAIIRADGHIRAKDLQMMRRYLIRRFGSVNIDQRMKMLTYLSHHSYTISAACVQLRYFTNEQTRTHVFRFLMKLAFDLKPTPPQRTAIIKRIANELGIGYYRENAYERNGSFFDKKRVSNRDYAALEVDPQASDEVVKKAYRKMVLRYHPDRYKSRNSTEKRNARDAFQRIQEAYDKIREARGIK